MNGLHETSIVFREIDDTYIYIKNNIVKKVNPYNIKMFKNNFNKLSKNNNIVIDYRLDLLILYSFIEYGDSVLIYDSYNSSIKNIYQWFSVKFSITIGYINDMILKKIAYMYVFIVYLLQIPDLAWNNSKAIDIIRKTQANEFFTMDLFINYIGPQYGKINDDNVKELYKNVVNFINVPTTSIIKFCIKNLTIYDVLATFKLLYKNNIVIRL